MAFKREFNNESSRIRFYDFNPELNSNWAVYHFDLVLPVGSPPGEWGMASADIRDKAGNIKRYSFVEYSPV